MTGVEALGIAIQVFVLGLAVWIIKNGQAAQGARFKELFTKIDRLTEKAVQFEIFVKNCLTWEDIEGLRKDVSKHGIEIAEIKAHCQERHK